MRKAYNIVVTLLLLAVTVAFFVLSGRSLYMLIRLGWLIDFEYVSDYYGGSAWFVTYLLGIPFTIMILAVRIVLTIMGNRSGTANGDARTGGKLGLLLGEQRPVVESWLKKTWDKKIIEIYAIGAILTICLYGVYWNRFGSEPIDIRPVEGFMSCLFMGEAAAVLGWLMIRKSGNLEKVIGGFEKNIKKVLGDAGTWEAFSDDVLSAGSEWTFRDEVKDHLGWGIVGSRYAVLFKDIGTADVVDCTRLVRVGIATTSYSTGKGWARQRVYMYMVRFYYEKEKRKKHIDESFEFKSDMNRTMFMNLLKSRLGDRVEIVQE